MTTEFLRAGYELLKICFSGLRLLTQNSALDQCLDLRWQPVHCLQQFRNVWGTEHAPAHLCSTPPACHTQDRTAETLTVASPAAIECSRNGQAKEWACAGRPTEKHLAGCLQNRLLNHKDSQDVSLGQFIKLHIHVFVWVYIYFTYIYIYMNSKDQALSSVTAANWGVK